MASTTDEFIEALCPELAVEALKDVYVEIGAKIVSSSFFGTSYNYALALASAHVFTMAQRGANETGVLTGKSENRASESYWVKLNTGSNSTLPLTKYGKDLKALIRTMGGVASVGDDSVL